MIQVMIADDHLLLREGFKTLLRNEPGIHIVAEATNGRELLQKLSEISVDVVITDIQMPQVDGIQATRQIRTSYPEVKTIALSMHMEHSIVIEMLKAGASGYLTKNASKQELLLAIQTVYGGGNYYCNETSPALTQLIDRHELNPYRRKKPVELSEKEISIMQLICQEYSTKQIAPIVHLTKRTVDSYRENILEKIDAKNVVGIALYAIKNGFFSLERPSQ